MGGREVTMWILLFAAAHSAEVWYDDVDQDGLGGNDFDQDGDGHASTADVARYATVHAGWSYEASWSNTTSPLPPDDCDDQDSAVHPGATEVCQFVGGTQVDEDCDGSANTQGGQWLLAPPTSLFGYHLDNDGDGQGAGPAYTLCDPSLDPEDSSPTTPIATTPTPRSMWAHRSCATVRTTTARA
jgi:hypothetical protein